MALFLLASLPAFVGGFLEDLTRRVSPYSRLLFAFGAAAVGYVLLDGRITDLDLPGDDHLFQYEIFAFGFTLFAVGGFAHAKNIVDGMNGLSGLVGIAILTAIAGVAVQVGDAQVLHAALVVGAAVLGFLAWNYPRGAIFAGDGGAYFLGFAIGELAVLLVHRNSEVSPWFALLVLWYPVWETVFSMYRRKVMQGHSTAAADALAPAHARLPSRGEGTRPQEPGGAQRPDHSHHARPLPPDRGSGLALLGRDMDAAAPCGGLLACLSCGSTGGSCASAHRGAGPCGGQRATSPGGGQDSLAGLCRMRPMPPGAGAGPRPKRNAGRLR